MKAHLLKHVPKELRDEILGHNKRNEEILADGGALRIPMRMMDGSEQRVKIGDGSKNFARNHAGWRLSRESMTDSAVTARQKLYDDYDKTVSQAYLKDDYGAQGRGSKEGDPCTCRNVDYPLDVGSPGHLKMVRGELTCVPDNPKSKDAKPRRRKTTYRDPEGREQGTAETEEDLQDARSIRDAEYARYENDLVNAWRGPINEQTPSNKRPTAGTVLHDTAASAYLAYDSELESAWKNGK